MLTFKTKRASNGRRSRWNKKFPRAKIRRLGESNKAVIVSGHYKGNWNDDSYRYFGGDLHKFLMSNLGKPIDLVFSEFIRRCKKSSTWNLRKEFMSCIEDKDMIWKYRGFYVSNGILNYKKRTYSGRKIR